MKATKKKKRAKQVSNPAIHTSTLLYWFQTTEITPKMHKSSLKKKKKREAAITNNLCFFLLLKKKKKKGE